MKFVQTEEEEEASTLKRRIRALERENAELKEENSVLKKEKQDWHVFVNYSQDILCVANLENGYAIRINKAAENISGYAQEELLNTPYIQFTHPDDRPEFEKAMQELIEGKEYAELTSRMLCKDGSIRWINWKTYGRQGFIYTIGRDVTDQQEVERQLQESHKKFRTIFLKAPVGMARVDPNGDWIDVNQVYCEIVGYSFKELKKKSFVDLTHPDDQAMSREKYKQIAAGEVDYYNIEKRYIHKAGHVVWIDLAVNAVRDTKGSLRYVIGTVKDITERKEAEEALRYKNHELDTLVYRASHDLKGPVASLMGLCNVAQNEIQDEVGLKYFRLFHQTVYRFDKLITNLLDITHIKHREVNAKPVNFREIIAYIIEVTQPNYRGNIDLQVNVNLSNALYSDAYLIQAILHNLIENGLKYVRNKPSPRVSVSISEASRGGSKGVIMEVADNGAGIRKEDQSKVFDMFFRANDSTPGTGIGLYIVKNAAERLQANINLNSKKDKGASFKVFVPDLAHGETKELTS